MLLTYPAISTTWDKSFSIWRVTDAVCKPTVILKLENNFTYWSLQMAYEINYGKVKETSKECSLANINDM